MSAPPRKLLLVVNDLFPAGGAETQLAHLARGLADLGHHVTVCCIGKCAIETESFKRRGIKVVAFGVTTRSGRAKAIPRLMRLARQADVVHCTMWDSSLWGRIAAILARRPVIVADHATDRVVQTSSGGAPRARWIALHNRLLDRFTFATVACASSQHDVLVGEGIDPAKIVHIPNGIPVDETVLAAKGGPTRKELGLPKDAPLVIQVGVFREEKNQLGALDSFTQVRAEISNAQLVFVGDGPTRQKVERRTELLDAGEWAHFLGIRTDVPRMLALADVMLLPSISDAMPVVVLEAMALGVPVVATDVGDIRENLADRAGICVTPNDPQLLASACIELLKNGVERREMGAAGRQLVRRFDSSVLSRRYAALFEAAATHGGPISALENLNGLDTI